MPVMAVRVLKEVSTQGVLKDIKLRNLRTDVEDHRVVGEVVAAVLDLQDAELADAGEDVLDDGAWGLSAEFQARCASVSAYQLPLCVGYAPP